MAGVTTATGLPANWTGPVYNWPIEFSNVERAWQYATSQGRPSKGEGIVIAHPDVGYTKHPELMKGGRLLGDRGANFVDPPDSSGKPIPPYDFIVPAVPLLAFHSHGTGTASVIMSSEGHPYKDPPLNDPFLDHTITYNEATSVTGVAPRARLVPYKLSTTVMLDDESDANLAKAIYHAMSLKAGSPPLDVAVMSISMGRPPWSIEHNIRSALVVARNAGIVVCCAAGQYGPLPVAFPACDPNTIAAAACGPQHQMLANAFYGPEVDITAPGVDVWRAWTARKAFDLYHTYSVSASEGTSFAVAMTAGACALWQAYHGRDFLIATYGAQYLTELFRYVLKASCDVPPGWNTAKYGAGVLDVEALLKAPLPAKSNLTLPP